MLKTSHYQGMDGGGTACRTSQMMIFGFRSKATFLLDKIIPIESELGWHSWSESLIFDKPQC